MISNPINPDKNSKFTCIKNQFLSIKIAKSDCKYYVMAKSKAVNDLEIVTIHTTEKDAFQKMVSYLLGCILHKIEKMNITQLKESGVRI